MPFLTPDFVKKWVCVKWIYVYPRHAHRHTHMYVCVRRAVAMCMIEGVAPRAMIASNEWQ